MPGFQLNRNIPDVRPSSKKTKKSKPAELKRDVSANDAEFSAKMQNNFFNMNKFQDPSSLELQEILNQGGVSDINIKKQMLINKIKNNEIDPDKYIKFMDAINNGNEPDEEAAEVSKKGGTKPRMPQMPISTQGPMPVVNFNYNSYIKIGPYPPPVINTLIVNGNNYMNDASNVSNVQLKSSKKGIRDFVTTSKDLLGSNKSKYIAFSLCSLK